MDALAHLHELASDLDSPAVFIMYLLSGEIFTIDPATPARSPIR